MILCQQRLKKESMFHENLQMFTGETRYNGEVSKRKKRIRYSEKLRYSKSSPFIKQTFGK